MQKCRNKNVRTFAQHNFKILIFWGGGMGPHGGPINSHKGGPKIEKIIFPLKFDEQISDDNRISRGIDWEPPLGPLGGPSEFPL